MMAQNDQPELIMADYPEDDWIGIDEEYESWDDDPCDRCGPWCEHWGGDGLCMLAIEQQAKETKEFEMKYVSTNS